MQYFSCCILVIMASHSESTIGKVRSSWRILVLWCWVIVNMGSYCRLCFAGSNASKWICLCPILLFYSQLSCLFGWDGVFILFMLVVQLGNLVVIKTQSSCSTLCADISQCFVKYVITPHCRYVSGKEVCPRGHLAGRTGIRIPGLESQHRAPSVWPCSLCFVFFIELLVVSFLLRMLGRF